MIKRKINKTGESLTQIDNTLVNKKTTVNSLALTTGTPGMGVAQISMKLREMFLCNK